MTPYLFLAQIALQRRPGFAFVWPLAFSTARFLPRVVLGNVILKPAQWRVPRSMTQLGRDRRALAEVSELRNRLGLPRFVSVGDGDQRLVCDLETAVGKEILANALTKNARLPIEEWFAPAKGGVRADDQNYQHEFIMPFMLARSEQKAAERPEDAPIAAPIVRDDGVGIFPPGTPWVYFKLYCSPVVADRLLTQCVAPLLDRLRRGGLFDKWHFVRYGDPEWHLRLRIHARNLGREAVEADVQSCFAQYLEKETIWNVQADTYRQEIDRYGGAEALDLCERLFAIDSDCALRVVEHVQRRGNEELRWRAALLGAHHTLRDFGLGLGGAQRVMDAVCSKNAEAAGSGAWRAAAWQSIGSFVRSWRSC
jgi:hypothetical protein